MNGRTIDIYVERNQQKLWPWFSHSYDQLHLQEEKNLFLNEHTEQRKPPCSLNQKWFFSSLNTAVLRLPVLERSKQSRKKNIPPHTHTRPQWERPFPECTSFVPAAPCRTHILCSSVRLLPSFSVTRQTSVCPWASKYKLSNPMGRSQKKDTVQPL